jgi:hypothetical protein
MHAFAFHGCAPLNFLDSEFHDIGDTSHNEPPSSISLAITSVTGEYC